MPKQSYQPVPFVDAAHLTREEWLEYRKHAVCASDLPVIMELSGYKSVLRLFQEKVSRRPKEELDSMVAERLKREAAVGPPPPPMFDGRELIIDPNADFNLPAECGHALEPVIGKYFAIKLGVPVYKDTVMYAHPDYPFLMVDNDFIAITRTRKRASCAGEPSSSARTSPTGSGIRFWTARSTRTRFKPVLPCTS